MLTYFIIGSITEQLTYYFTGLKKTDKKNRHLSQLYLMSSSMEVFSALAGYAKSEWALTEIKSLI